MSDRTRILTEYLAQLKAENRPPHEKKSTLTIYFKYLDDTDIDFLKITIAEAQQFQAALTMKTCEDGALYYGSATVIAMITRVVSFYDYLKRRKLVAFNPFREIVRLRGEKNLPRGMLSEEEMGKVLGVLRKFMTGQSSSDKRRLYKAHLIAELMYATGARIHEIARLTVSDVDLARGVVELRDSKSSKVRQGILNEYTTGILGIFIKKTRPYTLTGKSDDQYLFGTHNYIRRLINEMTQYALAHSIPEEEKKITSHMFRHSIASHFLRNGCDIRYIQEFLGHETIKSTQIYTRVVKEDLRGIIDAYHPRSMQKVCPAQDAEEDSGRVCDERI